MSEPTFVSRSEFGSKPELLITVITLKVTPKRSGIILRKKRIFPA